MRQMIGHALRGPAVGGTTIAYLVALLDEGKQLADWHDPFHLVPDLVAAEKRYAYGHVRPIVQGLAWAETREVARLMRNHAPILRIDAHEAVASLWYVVKVEGKEGAGRPIAAYSNQAAGWDATVKYLKQADETTLAALDGNALLEQFFSRVTWPKPVVKDLDDLVKHLRACGCPPSVYGAEGRRACAPEVLARQIVDGDLGERDRQALISERYNELARSIYPTLRHFQDEVNDELYWIMHPDEREGVAQHQPVLESVLYGRQGANMKRKARKSKTASLPAGEAVTLPVIHIPASTYREGPQVAN